MIKFCSSGSEKLFGTDALRITNTFHCFFVCFNVKVHNYVWFSTGFLLSQAKPELIDVNVLMAAQLLVELAQGSQDQKLLNQIYQNVLFDFRIWSRSQFHVQIGHIQYLSTLVKGKNKSIKGLVSNKQTKNIELYSRCSQSYFC